MGSLWVVFVAFLCVVSVAAALVGLRVPRKGVRVMFSPPQAKKNAIFKKAFLEAFRASLGALDSVFGLSSTRSSSG